jgi:hypothetical protein
MAQLPTRAMGLAWYAREDYPRILEIMADAQTLPATYEKWLKLAEEIERGMMSQDHVVVRAVIDPDEFPAWCAARGLNVDADGRKRFASWVAFRQVKETH